MSAVIEVSSDWLALREVEDARARSATLARRVSGLLGGASSIRPLVVHDLGSGTGSMMRWLAPVLPGPQDWVLHDWNPRLTELATALGLPSDGDGAEVGVVSRTGDLGALTAASLEGASLVTASALLDVLTSSELHAIVGACVERRVPALFSLSVTGRVTLTPTGSADRELGEAFNAHQLREVDGRRLLGRYAPMIARGLFREAGWRTQTADTTWRLDSSEPHLLGEWWEGWVGAAIEQRPELLAQHSDELARRRSQVGAGTLAATVRHIDLVAWR